MREWEAQKNQELDGQQSLKPIGAEQTVQSKTYKAIDVKRAGDSKPSRLSEQLEPAIRIEGLKPAPQLLMIYKKYEAETSSSPTPSPSLSPTPKQ
jgi:hypothetical protein